MFYANYHMDAAEHFMNVPPKKGGYYYEVDAAEVNWHDGWAMHHQDRRNYHYYALKELGVR